MDPVLIEDDGSATPIKASGDDGFSVPVYDAIGDLPLLYSHVQSGVLMLGSSLFPLMPLSLEGPWGA